MGLWEEGNRKSHSVMNWNYSVKSLYKLGTLTIKVHSSKTRHQSDVPPHAPEGGEPAGKGLPPVIPSVRRGLVTHTVIAVVPFENGCGGRQRGEEGRS